jgi:hypothetical protein
VELFPRRAVEFADGTTRAKKQLHHLDESNLIYLRSWVTAVQKATNVKQNTFSLRSAACDMHH